MATCDTKFEKDLSEDLSPSGKEKKPLSCEEKEVISSCEHNADTGSNYCNSNGKKENNVVRNISDNNGEKDESGKNGEEQSEEVFDYRSGCVEGEGSMQDEKLSNLNMNRQGCSRGVNETLPEEDEGSEPEEQCDDEGSVEQLTAEEAEERMKEALELKKQGNDYFRKQEYMEGKDLYTKAIKRCPKEFTENRSIFYANRAACFQKLEDYETAISDCSKALELAPNYLKARLRRAQCYEKVEKLEEALEDYKIVFENDKSCQPAREAIMRLPEEIKVKHEKLKEEMIGKLKDLGNMVLRPFGLSTDNFKLQQDPNSGGYSINFQK